MKISVNVLNIYIYRVTPPKKKTEPIYFLTEIHKFNSSLFFFTGYEVDSVQKKKKKKKLGPSYSPTCPEVQEYKIRIILLYFCRSNKKSLRVLFFF